MKKSHHLLFLDTEFTGLTRHARILSIALVADTGEEFYAEFNDVAPEEINDWVRDHVFPRFEFNDLHQTALVEGNTYKYKDNRDTIARLLRDWLNRFDSLEIWADVLAWDWVLFCDLFGGAFHIPEHIFYAPFDLATLFRQKGLIIPQGKYEGDIPRYAFAEMAETTARHNALADARVNSICYKKLMGI